MAEQESAKDMDAIEALEEVLNEAACSGVNREVLESHINDLLDKIYSPNDSSPDSSTDIELNQGSIIIRYTGLTLDRQRNTVEYKGQKVELYPRSALLLGLFMIRAGEVIPYESIVENIYEDPDVSISRDTIWVLISRLREQLEPLTSKGDWIKTIQREGYKFVLPEGE